MLAKFWELMADSTITQSTITLLLVGADVYLVIAARPIPDNLFNATMIVLGFWFGQKLNYAGAKMTKAMMSKESK